MSRICFRKASTRAVEHASWKHFCRSRNDAVHAERRATSQSKRTKSMETCMRKLSFLIQMRTTLSEIASVDGCSTTGSDRYTGTDSASLPPFGSWTPVAMVGDVAIASWGSSFWIGGDDSWRLHVTSEDTSAEAELGAVSVILPVTVCRCRIGLGCVYVFHAGSWVISLSSCNESWNT